MNDQAPTPGTSPRLVGWMGSGLLIATAALACLWLWHCWCVFPSLLFNEARLQPSFLLASGLPVYPAPGQGPVSTWIYGPLPVLFFLPTTLARDAISALLTAGTLNFFFVLGPIAAVCRWWPGVASPKARLAAFMVGVAAWPASSFEYIQADNLAVSFGLLASLFLIHSRSNADGKRWAAAVLAVAAVGCKQTALGVLIAQIVWIGWREGISTAVQQAIRCGVAGVILMLATVAAFGAEEVWFNLIEVPRRLPLTHQLFLRVWDLRLLLMVHVVGPALFLAIWRRRIWVYDSPWLLPALIWLFALPPGVASLLKLGGTLNSVESLLLFLPPALVILVSHLRADRWMPMSLAAGACMIVMLRLYLIPHLILQPRVDHLRQGTQIARQLSGQIWFPWNPLITYYTEGRMYHGEDGMFIRYVAGYTLTVREAHQHLPAKWTSMAIPTGSSDWGLATHLCPPDAMIQEVGLWKVYSWPLAKPEIPPPAPL